MLDEIQYLLELANVITFPAERGSFGAAGLALPRLAGIDGQTENADLDYGRNVSLA